MKEIRKGNDIVVTWFLKREGEPFILEGLSLTLYLKSMYDKKPLSDYSVNGNKIIWTFYGKDQIHTGNYSLELVVNKDEKGMMTTDACNFVRIVSCSCRTSNGWDDCGIKTEVVDIESEVEYGGSIIVVDKVLSPDSENAIANNAVYREFDAVKQSVKDILTIAPLSGNGVIAAAFKQYALAEKVGTPIACLIKKDGFEKYYTNAILTVEQYDGIGFRLNFCILNAVSDAVSPDDMETIYKPDCVLGDGKTLSYLYNPESGYVIPLGEGRVNLDLRRDNVIPRDIIIDLESGSWNPSDLTVQRHWSLTRFEEVTGKSIADIVSNFGNLSFVLKYRERFYRELFKHCHDSYPYMMFDIRDQGYGILVIAISYNNVSSNIAFPDTFFTPEDKEKLDTLKNYDDTEVKSKLEELEEAIKALYTNVASLQNNS